MGPKRLDLFLIDLSAHNVYYVKLDIMKPIPRQISPSHPTPSLCLY